MNTTDGIEAHRLLDRLKLVGRNDRMSVLQEYARSGPLDHVRTHTASLLADLVSEHDSGLSAFFEASLADPHPAYWSIQGIVRVLGARSFPILIPYALDSAHSVERRAKAVREMALLSGQTFANGLPSDPGYWEETDLPVSAIREWADAGFP